MDRRSFCALGCSLGLVLAGCRNIEDRPTKVLIGGTLLDGAGSPAISDAVVVVQDRTVTVVGTRAGAPIPQNSERVDVTGLFVVPVAFGEGMASEQLSAWSRSTLPVGETFAAATGRGSLVPGRVATFVVLGGDPTVANSAWGVVKRVMVRGRWVA